MSIRKKQIIGIADNIIKQALQQGKFPSQREVLGRISQYLKWYVLGSPTMQLRLTSEGRVDVAGHNISLDEVEKDLAVLYQDLADTIDKNTATFVRFDSEHRKLAREIDKVLDKLRNLILVADNTNDYIYTIHDYLRDMSNIDTVTSTVDFTSDGVVIGQNMMEQSKVDIGKAMVWFEPRNEYEYLIMSGGGEEISHSQLLLINQDYINELAPLILEGTINAPYLLQDFANTTWFCSMVSSADSGTHSGTLHILLEEPVPINKIAILMSSPKNTMASIRYSPDDLNWFTIDTLTIRDNKEIDINEIMVSQLEIILSKDEPDISEYWQDANGHISLRHIYNFSITNISLYRIVYLDSGLLETVEFSLPERKPIESISLWTDESIPAGTNINYMVNLGGSWTNISPINRHQPRYNTTISMGNIIQSEPENFILDATRPPAEYEEESYRTHGIRFYKLGTIDHDAIPSSMSLYRGKNMWHVGTYKNNLTLDTPADIGELLDDATMITSDNYVPVSWTDPLLGISDANHNTTYRFSISFFISGAQNIITMPTSQRHLVIYLNNRKIYNGTAGENTTVSYGMRKGWNTIDVFMYVPQYPDPDGAITSSIDIALDLIKYSDYIYAIGAPLERVSLFDLQFNVRHNDYTKYAAVARTIPDGESTKIVTDIVLNHCPLGMPFDIFYKFSSKQIQKIKLRAMLTRSDISNISPRLKGYQIRFM